MTPRIEPVLPLIAPPPQPAPPRPLTPQEALAKGVLIVVSLPSQKMVVFKDGDPWGASPVSTGRRGHPTPAGVFPILQKRLRHRSNLYGGAPMPYMQRLTWDGVALHAGYIPGVPASHGCIRLPWPMARSLYALTDFASTAVLVTKERLRSTGEALAHGRGEPLPTRLAASTPTAPVPADDGPNETIQLAASASAEQAADLWRQLQPQRPELRRLSYEVIPATVGARRVFRLRATGAAAHAVCTGLLRAGVPCLKVS
jgi:hypothetical protein